MRQCHNPPIPTWRVNSSAKTLFMVWVRTCISRNQHVSRRSVASGTVPVRLHWLVLVADALLV